MKRVFSAWIAIGVLGTFPSLAQITMPEIFSDNMVLQQRARIELYGNAAPESRVTVALSWSRRTHSTHSDSTGRWSVTVSTPHARSNTTIHIYNMGDTLSFSNVAIGEVWLASGQSNMEMPVAGWGKVKQYRQEVADARYPDIRLLQIAQTRANTPQIEVATTTGGWVVCSPESIETFSATGYFFARELYKVLQIPIGVIDCSWGGTRAEAWCDYRTLKGIDVRSDEAEILLKTTNPEQIKAAYDRRAEKWDKQIFRDDAGFEHETAVWAQPDFDDSRWRTMNLPGYWEKRGLPGFDGVAWFRKKIKIPASWQGRELKLSAAAIDDMDIAYWNGVEIARGEGFNTPRRYTVPAQYVTAGDAVITLRVTDFESGGGIHGRADSLYIACASDTLQLAGAWQYAEGLSFGNREKRPVSPIDNPSYPTVLYNGMIAPLSRYAIKGCIWYQGESNVGDAPQYARLFPALISSWRQTWDNLKMPFFFVQLANYMQPCPVQTGSAWAALREAQTAALDLPHTGMAVTIDIGEADDIHPKNKQEVGRRLALLALSQDYHRHIEAEAPRYAGYRIEGNRIRLTFNHIEKGFLPTEIADGDFIIADEKGLFYPATANVEGRTIVVSSPHVTRPTAVRYGWADNPSATLYGANGLPVAPFRTDK